MHDLDFRTWVSSARELAKQYDIQLSDNFDDVKFKTICKHRVQNVFASTWYSVICNQDKHPLLRTYKLIKSAYQMEPYLFLVQDVRYRNSITKLRASSHALQIERGRYTRPKTPVENRLCPVCKTVEDEEHFLLNCKINSNLRVDFTDKMGTREPMFNNLSDKEKFVFLLTNDDPYILSWLGKFLYQSFHIHNEYRAAIS